MAGNEEAPPAFGPRPVTQADLIPLARLWHQAWHETQAPFVPATLVALRTEPDFLKRLTAMGDRVRTIGPISAPLGFCAIDDDHMDQLFLAAHARGTGAGAILLADAETRMRANGITHAQLDCLKENAAAIRFYQKAGWAAAGIRSVPLYTHAGPFSFDCMVLTKALA